MTRDNHGMDYDADDPNSPLKAKFRALDEDWAAGEIDTEEYEILARKGLKDELRAQLQDEVDEEDLDRLVSGFTPTPGGDNVQAFARHIRMLEYQESLIGRIVLWINRTAF